MSRIPPSGLNAGLLLKGVERDLVERASSAILGNTFRHIPHVVKQAVGPG
jgi:hypothetical protein